MAVDDNLGDFLTNIADTIRSKKNTTGEINAQSFSAEIASIETGSSHTHENKTILDNTTASYTTEEKTKLAGLSNYDDTEVKNSIAANSSAISSETTARESADTTLQANIDKKVDKVAGKDLSTNDFTNDYKSQVGSNTSARHTHSNKEWLDMIDGDVVDSFHHHGNKTILDNTTASYTTEEKEKLQGIEAEANKTTSVDGLSGGTISSAITVNGNVNGNYLVGTWLQATKASDTASWSDVWVNNGGWLYKRAKASFKSDLGVPNVSQSTGTSTTDVMSQKATTDELTAITTALSNKFTNHPQSAYDCNTCYDEGVYLVANGSNCPSGSPYGSLFVMPYRKPTGNTKPDFCTQIYIPNGDDSTSPNSMFYRTSLADSWNPWQTINNTEVIGSYSFGGTDRTGYIRFMNGFQIVWGKAYNKNRNYTYAAPFAQDGSYSVAGVSAGWTGSYGNYGMSNLTANGFYLNSDKDYDWCYIAVGVWKFN